MAHQSEQSAWHECPDQIIKDLKQGDSATRRAAWQRVIECKSSDLLDYTRGELQKQRLNPLHAEGVMEWLLIRAFEKIETFKGQSMAELYRWLCAFAANDVRNLSRKINPKDKNGSAPESIEGFKDKYGLEDINAAHALFPTDDVLSPETILCQKQMCEFIDFIVELALSRLSPVHKVIIRETVLGDKSLKEAAAKHNFAHAYLRNQVSRANEKFRKEVQAQLEEHKRTYPDRYEDIVKIQCWIDRNGE